MKFLYMGTPDFAVLPLAALIDAGHTPLGVVCQPDRPKGRGHKMLPPPTKEFALERGICVYQPSTLRDEEFLSLLRSLEPDVIIVAAYGKILPREVLGMPKYGCINIHASLLPKYRGAAPIQRAIMNGERESGVTIMYMAEGLDTGDMIKKESVAVERGDTGSSLTEKLSRIGAKLIVEVINEAERAPLCAQKQDDSLASYASKIEKADCRVDFSKSAEDIANLIRALADAPLALASLCHEGGTINMKLAAASFDGAEFDGECGEIVTIGDSIGVKCGKGTLYITELTPEGKGRMKAADFCRGRRASLGDRFM